jgi:protein-disulfide isomerase
MRAPRGARSDRLGAPSVLGLLALALTLLLGLPARSAAQDDDPLAGAPGLGWTVGEDDAPVTVVEFSDISCPYCAEFHSGTRAELIEEYVASGRVRWITLSYVSGLYRNSEALLVAAECAGRQGRYEAFLGAAYDEREAWLRAGEGEVAEVIEGLGVQLDLDPAALETCRTDPTVGDRLDRISALAPRVGVRGTPTWIVNGFPVMGALPLGYARQFIESQLEGGGG